MNPEIDQMLTTLSGTSPMASLRMCLTTVATTTCNTLLQRASVRTRARTLAGRLSAIGSGLILLLAASAVQAAEPVSKSRFGGVAIGGHDSVAYHELQREPQALAAEGNKRYTVEYKGAKWHFASEESAERFRADPERFSPAYNGFCANALSLGEGLIRTDGTHWEIFDDNLYLFYAARGRERWTDGNWEAYKADADKAWSVLSKK